MNNTQLDPLTTGSIEESVASVPPNDLKTEPVPSEPTVAELQQKIEDLENKLKDQQLRTQAEIQNIHRRAERDITQAAKYALEKFSAELLGVVDNLERALASSNPEDDAVRALRDGVVLTHKLFGDALKKFNIESVDPTGEPFKPELHQAVSTQVAPHAEPNTVLTVYQKGYLLNGRLLRPAIVVVSSSG